MQLQKWLTPSPLHPPPLLPFPIPRWWFFHTRNRRPREKSSSAPHEVFPTFFGPKKGGSFEIFPPPTLPGKRETLVFWLGQCHFRFFVSCAIDGTKRGGGKYLTCGVITDEWCFLPFPSCKTNLSNTENIGNGGLKRGGKPSRNYFALH